MSQVATRAGVREWAGLGLLALPTVLLGLDLTVLYLVLPSLTVDLEPTATQTLWIMDGYGFLIAGFLITMGTLGDRMGRRRLLMIGVAAFGVVSVFAAIAPSAASLIVARALLGVAGATLMPSTLSLISNMFTDVRQRALAIGTWATMFALGMADGPVVGGALVAQFWWGAAFLIAVPIAVIVLAGAPALLPAYTAPREGRFDLVSVVLSLISILPIVYAIKQFAAHGPDASTLSAVIIGAVAAFAFVRRQLRLPAPLLDMTLFRSRAFCAALAVLLIGLVGVGGAMFLVTQYLQLVQGLPPAVAGLWMGPPALAMLVAAVGAPFLARHLRPGTVMAATLAFSLAGYGLLATAGTDDRTSVVIGFTFVYLGLGAIAALGTDIVVGAAPPEKSGSAAAMSETVQELGIAVGVAVLGSLITAIYRARLDTPTGATPQVADAVTDSLGGAVSVSELVPSEPIAPAQAVFTTGLNIAAVAAGVAIAAVAAVSAIWLRHIPPIGETEE